MDENQKIKMQWYMFSTFLILFVIVSLLTIMALFFDFGQLEAKYKDDLTRAFVLEIGAVVVALVYAIFNLKEPTSSLGTHISQKNNIGKSLTTNDKRILRALIDEPHGRLIVNYTKHYKKELDKLINDGMVLKHTDGRYKLTKDGMKTALSYIAELVGSV